MKVFCPACGTEICQDVCVDAMIEVTSKQVKRCAECKADVVFEFYKLGEAFILSAAAIRRESQADWVVVQFD